MGPRSGLVELYEGLSQLSINLEEIFSRVHGNCEESNKVLESSIIIINY